MLHSRWAPDSEPTAAAQSEKPTKSPALEKADVKDPPPSYDPAYEDPSIDPFAQTASADHLFFDDDITPIAEPVVEPPAASVISNSLPAPSQPELASHPSAPREPQSNDRGGRGRARGRGRGRGGGGGGRGGSGHSADVRDSTDSRAQNEAQSAVSKDAESLPVPEPITVSTAANSSSNPVTEPSAMPSAPTEPKEKPTHSVRGDRTLTGGAARTRLTEEQLNVKLANMRSKNEALQTAHARAEADQAKFEAREAVLKKQDVERKKVVAEKQKQERQNRAQMMGERERNRQRKLNAQGGREWDFEKEEGFSGTGEEKSRTATRGAHGGIAPSRTSHAGSPSEQVEEDNAPQSYRGRGRGRGGRGNRGGRGDHSGSNKANSKKREEQQPPSAADFPELPSSAAPAPPKEVAAPKNLEFPVKSKTTEAKTSEPERPGIQKQESFGLPSPMEKGRSWADEVS